VRFSWLSEFEILVLQVSDLSRVEFYGKAESEVKSSFKRLVFAGQDFLQDLLPFLIYFLG